MTELVVTAAQIAALAQVVGDDQYQSVVLRLTADGVLQAAWDGPEPRLSLDRRGEVIR